MRAFGLDVVVLRDVRRLRCYIGASIASRGRALRVVAAAAALYGVVARAGVRGAALRLVDVNLASAATCENDRYTV